MVTYGVYQNDSQRRGKAAANSEATNHDGIFAHIGDRFQVTPDAGSSGLRVCIGTGKAKFDQTWTMNNEVFSVPLSPADPVLPRIDTVVLEVGRTLFGRKNRIFVLPGTPALSPEGAPLKTGSRCHQYPLAEIQINPGVRELSARDISNLTGTPRCPFTDDIRFQSTFKGTTHQNDPACVAELLALAKTYYDVRGTKAHPTFFYNQSDPACFDRGFNPANPSLRRNIDCSTYVNLLLRGIPFEKSPYQGLIAPEGSPEAAAPGTTRANSEEYPWVMDSTGVTLSVNPDERPRPIRTASQIAEWMEKQNLAIPLQPDLSNVEPGDIIFWAKTRPTGEFIRPRRYRKISHIAVCYAKLPQPDTVTTTDYAGVRKVQVQSDVALRRILAGIDRGDFLPSVKDHRGKGTGKYSFRYASGVWTVSREPDKDQEAKPPIAVKDLSEYGIGLERIPDAAECSFTAEVYYWERKYPFKHTMMEVTTKPPYVLNQTLEKSRPGNVVLVCRPRLYR